MTGQFHGIRVTTDPAGTVLEFAFPKNPIPANGQRGTWHAHARRVKAVRQLAFFLARVARIDGRMYPHVDIALTWHVTTNRRRDADNLVPVMKAMVDGLTEAGVIPDDNDTIVTRHMPRIVPAPAGATAGWMELTIRPTEQASA